MHDELAEIHDFLADCPPFDELGPAALSALTRRFVIRYLRRGSSFPPGGSKCLWVIRQGAIELRNEAGELTRRMSEGDVHATACLPNAPESAWQGHAVEDSLLYGLPCADLEALWAQHPEMHQKALEDLRQRLRRIRPDRSPAPERDLGSLPLATLIGRPPITTGSGTSILEAASLMTRERVSALLIVDDEQLCGILTDRDLRSRCLATGLPDSTPVSAIMTPMPCTLPPDAPAFEALLEMSRRGIHHLPISEHGRLLGLVSSTDLLRAQGISSLYLADRIRRAADLAELAGHAAEIPEVWLNLAQRGENTLVLGRIVSSLGDALASRLLALAETRLGPPPVPYAWIAYGSQGRRELTLHSDQDNALILADGYDAARHADYFARLADEVCDGLAVCGFVHCPGGMMATNGQWRQTLSGWRDLFTDWVTHTDPQKARLASNLFDYRVIHGEEALARPLRELITVNAPRHEVLLGHLIANGCTTPPPLGLFRQLVVISEGEHAGQLDVKLHGILPIVDLARIHALAAGVEAIGTIERLRGVAGARLLSREGAETLVASLVFLLALRTRHQKEQLTQGQPADNFISPASLSAGDREKLRDVFRAIAIQQKALLQAFPYTLIK